MKFGSVKFFKRIIVTTFILLVLVPLVLAVVFGVLYGRQKERADWMETVNRALLSGTGLPQGGADAEDFAKYFQNKPEEFVIEPSFDYQKLYPHLYAVRPPVKAEEGKVCYLTFDDGPSPTTFLILKTLEENGIKATFFVTGKNSIENEDVLRAAAAAGHTIGVHTYSHKYEDIYASVESYLADFEQMYTRIIEVTGTPPTVFRFAGGSLNAYNQYIYTEIIAEMTRRGFVFYDWNAAANDAVAGGASRQQIVDNVLNSAAGKDRLIVLMHDRNDTATTAQALPGIIEGLKAQGYTFAPLTADVKPITFFYQEEMQE